MKNNGLSGGHSGFRAIILHTLGSLGRVCPRALRMHL